MIDTIRFESIGTDDIALAGGKGANLGELTRAGLPVPSGFVVTTAAYRALTDDQGIREAIETLDSLDADEDALTATAVDLRDRIREREFDEALVVSLADTLDTATDADATDVTYSVRSSATAEDLPTASFAGQHETYLGVAEDDVLDRVRECMASLFTDRAVAYRARNGVPHAGVEMAVVVQEMVEPEAAGVLFTADPVTGNRRVATIDASFGLGDAVVAGDVSSDNARFDRRTGSVIDYAVGEKALAIRSRTENSGTETVAVAPDERATRALSDEQVRALAGLGERVERLLGVPADVEWALLDGEASSDTPDGVRPHDGEFVLLQARPITSLYPLPSPIPDDALHVYFSFGHQQAMPEALPPLVVDFWRGFIGHGAARFRADPAEPTAEAGSRVYVDLTPLLRIGAFRRALPRALNALNEPAANGLGDLLDRRRNDIPPRGRVDGLFVTGRALRRGGPILRWVLPRALRRFVAAFVRGPPDPGAERSWCETWGRRLAASVDEPETIEERVRAGFDRFDLAVLLATVVSRMVSLLAGVVAGKALGRSFPAEDIDALGKGFETELVTEMNQRLGDLADIARESPAVAAALGDTTTLADVEAADGSEAFVTGFEAFLHDFGHRATGEIDLRRPRWRDDPMPLLRTVRSTVEHGETGAHRDHLHALEARAEVTEERLEARANTGPLGPVRAAVVRRLIRTYRTGVQLREYPKQGLSHLFAAVHDAVTAAGESLAADGRLDRPDDAWFLRKTELFAALRNGAQPIDADIAGRRRTHERYAAMVAPPLLTSEGESPASADDDLPEGTLAGTPVSAGVVEGRARVVRNPAETTLETGEILVAPSTDPGWTPLFLNAAGLVMEVGGRMTHGALVAREYGIPAVASVSNATTTIRTGERIRVDGATGTVEIID